MDKMKIVDITDEEYEIMKSFDYDDETDEISKKEITSGDNNEQ